MKNIKIILIIAFVLRFILLLINEFVFILPQGGGDAIGFERGAYYYSISDYSSVDYYDIMESGVILYKFLLSYIYVLFGRLPLILGFTNVLLGTYLVYLVYKGTLLLWENKMLAKKAAWIITFFPLLMIESALVLREIPIMVFMMLAIISFIKFWKYHHKTKIIGFIFYTFMAAVFHSGMLFILIGFLFFINFNSKRSKFLNKLMSITLVILALFFMNQYGIGTNKIGGSFDKSLELLKLREEYDVTGGSHYPSWMRLSGNITDFYKIPIRYLTFLFSPLIPWLIRSIWHLVGLLDAFIYLFMFYRILKYRKIFKYNETAKAIFIMILFLVLAFSLGVTNVGTAIRHRAKFAPLLVVLSIGMNKNQLLYYKYLYYNKIQKNIK